MAANQSSWQVVRLVGVQELNRRCCKSISGMEYRRRFRTRRPFSHRARSVERDDRRITISRHRNVLRSRTVGNSAICFLQFAVQPFPIAMNHAASHGDDKLSRVRIQMNGDRSINCLISIRKLIRCQIESYKCIANCHHQTIFGWIMCNRYDLLFDS